MLSSILKATNDFVTSGLLMATLMLKIVCKQPLEQVCPSSSSRIGGSRTAAVKLVEGAGGHCSQVRLMRLRPWLCTRLPDCFIEVGQQTEVRC